MNNVRQTSILAYTEAKKDLGRKQSEVLQALRDIYPATNLHIAEHLGWAINSVTPRVLELRNKRRVVEVKKDIDPRTGRKSIFWRPHQMEAGEV